MKPATFMSFITLSAGYIFQPENETDFRNVPQYSRSLQLHREPFRHLHRIVLLNQLLHHRQRRPPVHGPVPPPDHPQPQLRLPFLHHRTRVQGVLGRLTYCTPKNGSGFDNGKPLNADYGTYAFGSTSDDSVSSMYAFSHTENNFSIDLEWNFTSRVMLNGGTGIIPFGNVPFNATEWGVPAGKTSGTITINNRTISVDPSSSFTWYDRQLSHGAPKNWTWFQVNFPGSDVKASVWAYDLIGDESTRFATVRSGNSYHVVAYDLVPDYAKTWTSPKSNITYPLSWSLKFENGDHLQIESIRPDQEMYGDRALVDSAYEGFVEVRGSFYGQEEGFGVAELVSAY